MNREKQKSVISISEKKIRCEFEGEQGKVNGRIWRQRNKGTSVIIL